MLSKEAISKIIDNQTHLRAQQDLRAQEAAQKACSGLMQFKGKFDTKNLFDQMLHDTCKKNGIRMYFNDDAQSRKEQIALSKYPAQERERLGIDKDFQSVVYQEQRSMVRNQSKELESAQLSERPTLQKRHELESDLFEYQSAKMRFDHKIDGHTEPPVPSAALAQMVAQNLSNELAAQNGTSATALSRFAVNHPERKSQIQSSVYMPLQQMQAAQKLSASGNKVASTFEKLNRVLPKAEQAAMHSSRMRATTLNLDNKSALTVSPSQSKRAAKATQAQQEQTVAKSTPKRTKRKAKLSEEAMTRIDGYGKQYDGALDFVARTNTRNQQKGLSL